MKTPLRTHANATFVVRKNEYMGHLPILHSTLMIALGVASAFGACVTLSRRDLAPYPARFLGVRGRG